MMQRGLFQISRDFLFKSLNGQIHVRLKTTQSNLGNGPARSSRLAGVLWLWTMSNRIRSACCSLNSSLNVLSVLFAKQCNAIAAQRIRRSIQIVSLYCRLYDGQSTLWRRVIHTLARQLRRPGGKPLYFLFSASLFSWEKEKITDQAVDEQIGELNDIVAAKKAGTASVECLEEWENLINRDNLTAWRKPVGNGYLYEYKVFGTFRDIPARAFFNIQVDLEYRKQWDKLVIKLDMVDRDEDSGCEVIQWIMHYPFPMYSREYVYMRRCVVDLERKIMLVMSHSVDHPSCPVQDNYVRVNIFRSQMVIKPHSSFDENGFDYVLTYYDDPQAAFPSAAYNWMASTGVPDFVDKMHVAARILVESKSRDREDEEYSDTSRIPM